MVDSDELLIELMCEENEDAKIEFRKRYLSFIKTWLKSYLNVIKYMRMEEEDFVGEIYMYIYESLSNFNKEKGYFYSFAKTCFNHYMYTYIKKMNGSMRKTILDSLSIDGYYDNGQGFNELIEGDYHISDLKSYYESKETLKNMKEIINNLDDREKRLISYRYKGKKNKDISSIMSLNEKTIEYKCTSVKKKLTSCMKTSE